MNQRTIGVAVTARDSAGVLAGIERLEQLGIPAAWLTVGGARGVDSLTLLGAAAVRTQRIKLGTAIAVIWPRHPVTVAEQAHAIAQLAPGRFRLGLGPGHQANIERMFGINFRSPLAHLREYVHIVKTLLGEGAVDFDGRHYHAHTRIAATIDVPVMISALRAKSFKLAGAIADGAISWICPGVYLRDVAMPAMRAGAEQASRPAPPLVAHAPVCVHDDPAEARAAAREQMGFYTRVPFYAAMLAGAGFSEAAQGAWSDAMIDAVVLWGREEQVADRLRQLFEWGASEIVVSPIAAGQDRAASTERTLQLLAQVAKSI